MATAAAAQGPTGGDAPPPARRMVVTVDDLPGVSTDGSLEALGGLTQGILDALGKIPAVGFVNEAKLYRGTSTPDAARVAFLEQWLAAGQELGNHTYSHPSLHDTPLTDYQANVLRGERVTRPLSTAANRPFRYFRHPFLRTGRELETKRAFEAFLGEHGYQIAPVTIDNSEWIYARAYDLALDAQDAALAQRIGEDYERYMLDVTAYYEQQSRAILGYELPQILLIHANRLNGDRLASLLEKIAARGYHFIPLETALKDPAYERLDLYTGPAGITWLHRWALADGKKGEFFAGEPEVPEFVRQASGL